MPVFSFLDVQASITGPFGSFPLSVGPGVGGVAEEGISIEFTEDKDRQLIGADGSVMHSLNASKAGKATLRLQKTSPVNSQLAQMFNEQITSSLFWAKNLIVVANSVTGDNYTLTGVAFTRFPANHYAKEAGLIEWEFNVGFIDVILGSGVVSVAAGVGVSLGI
jgi:hypothetical protein